MYNVWSRRALARGELAGSPGRANSNRPGCGRSRRELARSPERCSPAPSVAHLKLEEIVAQQRGVGPRQSRISLETITKGSA